MEKREKGRKRRQKGRLGVGWKGRGKACTGGGHEKMEGLALVFWGYALIWGHCEGKRNLKGRGGKRDWSGSPYLGMERGKRGTGNKAQQAFGVLR